MLSKELPTRPEVFFEVSVGKKYRGRVYIRLWGHLRRAQHFLALCLGTLGPSYLGSEITPNGGEFPEIYIAGGGYQTSDGIWSSRGLMPNLEWGGTHVKTYRRGLVCSRVHNDKDTDAFFYVCTDENVDREEPGTLGQVVSGYDMLKKAVFDNPQHEQVIITRCGVVIPSCK